MISLCQHLCFLFNDFCFFEPAYEFIQEQIHLTSFIEFMIALNQRNHFEVGYFVLKAFWKSCQKSWKKTSVKVYFYHSRRLEVRNLTKTELGHGYFSMTSPKYIVVTCTSGNKSVQLCKAVYTCLHTYSSLLKPVIFGVH